MCRWYTVIDFILLRRFLKQTVSKIGKFNQLTELTQTEFHVGYCENEITWIKVQINHVGIVMLKLHKGRDQTRSCKNGFEN